MKKTLACLLVALMSMISVLGVIAEGSLYTPGTYTGKGNGIGEVTVTVTVDESRITDVVIDVSNETPEIGGSHADEYKETILAGQSAEIL